MPALNLREQPTDLAFFEVLNWMLAFMPPLPDEAAMRREFQTLGVQAGKRFAPPRTLQPAITEGMQQGLQAMRERAARVRSSAELFGSRELLGNDYLTRAVGAMLGILGNAAEEYLGVGWQADAEWPALRRQQALPHPLRAGQLPPVDAFWSITVYTQQRLLYANPLQRYVINSPMLPTLQRDPTAA